MIKYSLSSLLCWRIKAIQGALEYSQSQLSFLVKFWPMPTRIFYSIRIESLSRTAQYIPWEAQLKKLLRRRIEKPTIKLSRILLPHQHGKTWILDEYNKIFCRQASQVIKQWLKEKALSSLPLSIILPYPWLLQLTNENFRSTVQTFTRCWPRCIQGQTSEYVYADYKKGDWAR